jgi:hypothetical protein
MTIDQKLDVMLAMLERIEARQIKTTAMVAEVEAHETPVVGSFATVDSGHKP